MIDRTVISAFHYGTGKPATIEIRGGMIVSVAETDVTSKDQNIFVAPGMIDNQINGYKGVDFSDPFLNTEQMSIAVRAIIADGVTSFMPTIITSGHDNLIKIFRNLSGTLKDDLIRDSIIGFHLEGPYISDEAGYFGCHPPEFIRKPSWEEFQQYQDAAGGNIVQVTVSPETEGCIGFIDKCVQNNITVAIGHTNASAELINMAAEHGAKLSTHLGNGCANMIDRHRNPLWPQLANDKLIPTVIADGHHLLPEEVKVFCKVKGTGNIILTSDVTHLIGMAPGPYVFHGAGIVLTDDGLIKNPVLNCLAGASLPLRTGVGNVMRYTGCSLREAIEMVSANVARIYKLDDRGSIETGKRADLILFEITENKINIKKVLVRGKMIYDSQ
jgi:N-acetylglucosamine-6-phosphate deacetylase